MNFWSAQNLLVPFILVYLMLMQTTLCPLFLIALAVVFSAPSPWKLAGWNDGGAKLKKQSVFWHNVWTEAGGPPAGVLSSIKKHFKYEVRHLK